MMMECNKQKQMVCIVGLKYNLNLFKYESPFGTLQNIQQPTILLLRDGTDSMQGVGQIISNINAIEAIVDIVKTTLGTSLYIQDLEEWTK